MASTKINKLIGQCLFNLKENGMTDSALHYYELSGFNVIRKRHEEHRESIFSFEICDNLIRELRIQCENGTIPKHQWRVIRRCAEVMKNYQITGTTELPKLGKWEWLNAPYRVKPTPEQFADDNNIFTVVWNTKCELENMGMMPGAVTAYTYNGFDRILKHFISLGLQKYDENVINDFVKSHRIDTKQKKFQLLRKSASFVTEYYQTGLIKNKWLEQWDTPKPSKYFISVVERFKSDNDKSKNLSSRSKSSAYHAVNQFLMTLESMGYYDFQNITLKVVSDCISIMAKRYTSGLKPTLSYIRSFLRFIEEHNISSMGLVKAIPKSVSPKRAVYSGFSVEEIEKLLAAVDRTTTKGKRNYSILLLGIRTGMRAVDVVKLKHHNIDWRNHAINIVQSKTNQPLGIPLTGEVGNAVADYILNGRPACDSDNIFVRLTYPICQLTPPACGNIVREYYKKAKLSNVTNRPIGFHTLRRSFGTHLLESGVTADMIGELLGQLDPNSIQPYLAASEVGLKSCAIGLITLSKTDGGEMS